MGPNSGDDQSNPGDDQMLTFWSEPVDAFEDLALLSAALVIEKSTGEQVLTTEIHPDALKIVHSVTKIYVPADLSLAGTRAWISAYTEKGSYSQQVFEFE